MNAAPPPAVPLPMFPLGSVLFPHAPLALHVFEPRYRALVEDCRRQGQEFGVVLIERGHEVGGGDTRFGVGTVAHIREVAELPDGRSALGCVGTRRFTVRSWLPDDPYPVALVDERPEGALGETTREHLGIAEGAVRRALTLASELDEGPTPVSFHLHPDPAVAAWQLVAVAPLGPADHQRLLEIDDAAARLNVLTALAADASALLAYRLSGG